MATNAADLVHALDRFLERADRADAVAKAQTAYKAAIARRFRRQATRFLTKILPQIKGRGLVEAALREADTVNAAIILDVIAKLLGQLKDHKDDPELLKKLDAALKIAYATGASDITIEIDPKADLALAFGGDYPAAVQWLKAHAFENIAKDIDEVTAAGVRTILTEGLERGWSYSKIAGEIRNKFSAFSTKRATAIAVNEIRNAYLEGTLAAALTFHGNGVAMEKSWLTMGDSRVDPNCAANESAGWIGVDDTFPSGSPRPLDHPRCRCGLLIRRAKKEEPVGVLDG